MASRRGRGKGRQHTYRPPKDAGGGKFTGSHHCPSCGKWCFETRGKAEAAARYFHPGTLMRFYLCEPERKWWHYSSMPADEIAELRESQAVLEDAEDDDCDFCPTPCDCPKWRGEAEG